MKCVAAIILVFSTLLPTWTWGQPQGTKIGVTIPLSGPLAEYGQAVRNGLELAIEEIKKEARVPPTFVFEDSKYDATTAISAFHKLVEADGVKAILDWGSATSLAIAPIAEARKIPLIASAVIPNISAGKKYVLRNISSSDSFAKAMLHVVRQRGVKELHIVKVDANYYDQMFDSLEKFREPGEKFTVIYSGSGAISDLKTVVTKLRAAKTQMVAVLLFPGQLSAFYRERALQRASFKTIGADSFESKKEVRDSGNTMNGSVFVNISSASSFRARYMKRYGNDIQVAYAGNAYDFAMMLTEAKLNAYNGFSIARLLSVTPYEGVNGRYTIVNTTDKGPALESPIYVKQIVDGEFVTIESIDG